MKRFVSVWLPTFAIDRLRQASRRGSKGQSLSRVPDDRPFALIESGARSLTITAVNDRARAEGITIGQALADARAAIPDLLTQPGEPERDRARLIALAHGAGRYGPARNVEGDDGLWIDITGVAHLFGSERELGFDLIRRLNAAGFRALAGIADTPSAAFALARFRANGRSAGSRIAIAEPMGTSLALAKLPVEALRLEAQTIVLLKRLGLKCIGQLYDLPRIVLARRFRNLKGKGAGRAGEREGLAQAVVMRLDQALGRLGDPRVPLTEPPAYIVRRSYPDMLITAAGIETACRELADQLCTLLAAAHKGARRLRFSLYRADGSVADAMIGTSQPCRTSEHLLELFRDKLNALDVGFGVDMIVLEALQVEALCAAQSHFSAPGSNSPEDQWQATSALVDRLINRLGRNDVFRLGSVASHIPERAQRHDRTFSSRPGSSRPREFEAASHSRPPFLFSPPEPITVIAEVPEGPPARFTWRRATHRIVKAEGPERIAPEWWRGLGGDFAHGGVFFRSRAAPDATASWPSAGGPCGCGCCASGSPLREVSSSGRANEDDTMSGTARSPVFRTSAFNMAKSGTPDLALTRGGRHRGSECRNERHAPAEVPAATQPNSTVSDPERIRDYYTLEDDSGARYWVFRAGLYQREAEDGAPVWYMHGLFG